MVHHSNAEKSFPNVAANAQTHLVLFSVANVNIKFRLYKFKGEKIKHVLFFNHL